MARMDAAAGTANAKVLLHPTASKTVVHSSNHVAIAVVDFEARLGIESGRQSLDGRRWADAATEAKDEMLETGAEGVDVSPGASLTKPSTGVTLVDGSVPQPGGLRGWPRGTPSFATRGRGVGAAAR